MLILRYDENREMLGFLSSLMDHLFLKQFHFINLFL